MDDFDKFWSLYPKKKSKGDARKAWKQTEKIRPDISKLLQIVEQNRKTEQWMQDGGKWIPYPATWLRDEAWEDELEVKLPDVVNNKPWHETASGIEAKGRELGILPEQFESFPHFKTAVMRAAMKAA